MSYPRMKTVAKAVTVLNTQTTGSATIGVLGKIKAIYVPTLTLTSATYAVTITGPGTGFTLYTKALLAPGGNVALIIDANNFPLDIPCTVDTTITITTVGAEGADRVFNTKLLIEG